MQSGIGDEAELRRFGIPVVQHLPGVGRNLQDHIGVRLRLGIPHPLPPRNNGSEATYFWTSDTRHGEPGSADLSGGSSQVASAENIARFGLPESRLELVRRRRSQPEEPRRSPADRRRSRRPGARSSANMLSHPDDLKAAIACVELCREIGNSAALQPVRQARSDAGQLEGQPIWSASSAMPRRATGTRRAPPRWAATRCRWWTET